MRPVLIRFAVLLLAICQIVVAALIESGTLGPRLGETLERHPALVVPTPQALVIGVPILALGLLLALVPWWAQPREAAAVDELAVPVGGGLLATSAWMLAFQQQNFITGVVMACLVVGSLAVAAAGAQSGLARRSSVGRLVRAALGLHLGFASVMVLALADHAASAYGWSGFGLDKRFWAFFAVAMGGFAVAGTVGALRGNLAYAVAAIWGFVAIAVAQWIGPRAGTAPTVGTAAMFAALLVGMSSVVAVAKRASDRALWVRRGSRDSSRASLP